MKSPTVLVSVLATIVSISVSQAQESPRGAECKSDFQALSAANGMTVTEEEVGTFCECMGPQVKANPALATEIETNSGLPPKESASPEMLEAVESCLPAKG
ncbi:MAG: hypothetical protein H8E58_09990 [SAR92 clade bacterium]|nr:hypothetical protein [SAR92 clade bacterium]